jgi:hypothetical protein
MFHIGGKAKGEISATKSLESDKEILTIDIIQDESQQKSMLVLNFTRIWH